MADGAQAVSRASLTTRPSTSTDIPPPSTRPRTGGRRWPIAPVAVTVEIVVLIVIWQVIQGDLKLVNPVFLPPPSKIGDSLFTLVESGEMLTQAYASLSNFAIAFALACAVGIPLGLLVGGWFPAQKLIAPLLWALYAMPLIAIRPMTTVWFGFGNNPIIFLVFLAALLPITLNTAAGVNTVDPVLKKTALVFGASRLETYRKVVLPASVPFILTGLRLGVVIGWIILLASELHGAPRGFGSILAVATSRFRVDVAFATLVVIVLISVLSVRLIGLLEERVSSWRPERDR